MDQLNSFQLKLGDGSEIGMALTLALMMFSVALGLRAEHFRFFKTQPSIFFAGLLAQLLALPILTLGLCYLLAPTPSVALGMILIACCPGGNVSNLLVLLARGNIALSISLTASSSMAAAFVTPISIVFWCSMYAPTANLLTEVNFDTVEFLRQTSLILAVPLICGVLVSAFLPALAKRIQAPLVLLSSLGLVAIIVIACIRYVDQFFILGVGLIGIVALHNACAFLLGYLAAKTVHANIPSTRALTIEVGIQNSGLGIVILLTQLGGMGGAAAVAGLWGVWHIIAGLLLVSLFRSRRVLSGMKKLPAD
ncbi:MAG: bile acid:sodium symporter family protein [Gammaproteobacteria bacterium]|nr:bile acid:sodium symporter family protein [Gammaproteobacteria bacterium]